MRALRRTVPAAAAMTWLLLLTAAPAAAHASLRASQPAGGAAIEEAPEQVTLTFTESPDTALSSVKVVGASGSFENGPPRLADGDDLTLVVDLKALPKGSYTVSWRTVSRVDGHASAGAFAFGVGEPPEPVTAESRAPAESSKIPAAAARWILYLGLASLLGASWMALFAFGHETPPLRRFSYLGLALSVAGVAGLGVFQFREAGVGLGIFLGSSSGRALALRILPLSVVGLAFLLLKNRHRLRPAIATLGALAGMLAHSASGHAAVPPNVLAKVGVQWTHFLAVGIWIGGLAALLLGIRHAPQEERYRAAKRFSIVAGFAIFLVVGTGVLRAVNEVGGWSPLFDSTYGRLVVAKSVLVVGLGGLGALNRFRNVPVSAGSPQGLQKVGRAEVAVAVMTMALAGMLSSSVPPVSVAAAAEEARVSVEGTDFARTAGATFTLEPGTAGPNRFKLELTDRLSGTPAADVGDVTLRFSFLSDPAVGESTLKLEDRGEGRFEGSGSNVSIDGRWRVTVAVTTSGNSFEIPLEFSTRAVGYSADRSEVAGQPTIHSVTDPQGRQLQVYAQPDRPGRSELHLTLFDASGTELAVEEIVAIAVPPKESSITLVTRRFGAGHFAADVDLKKGSYRFDVTARTGSGEGLRFPVDMEVS